MTVSKFEVGTDLSGLSKGFRFFPVFGAILFPRLDIELFEAPPMHADCVPACGLTQFLS